MDDTTTNSAPISSSGDHTPYHLLLVEDDDTVRMALTEFLHIEGYRTSTCARGDQALDTIRERQPVDLVLLDIMLPGLNGYEVLEQMRESGNQTPVIMLTARGSREDTVRGLATGADDYVSKPFSAALLGARVKAILSRTQPPAKRPMDVHTVGRTTVNFTTNEVSRDGAPMRFTALEFDLLRYFINHEGQVLSREQLLRDIWRLPSSVETRTVDRHIASLRKIIEDDSSQPRHIQTVYGQGYRFVKRPPEAGERPSFASFGVASADVMVSAAL